VVVMVVAMIVLMVVMVMPVLAVLPGVLLLQIGQTGQSQSPGAGAKQFDCLRQREQIKGQARRAGDPQPGQGKGLRILLRRQGRYIRTQRLRYHKPGPLQ
jgi:hypothetical protein